jgi:hypothetical protein
LLLLLQQSGDRNVIRRALTLAAILLVAVAVRPQSAPTEAPQDSTAQAQNENSAPAFDERAAAAVLGTIRNGLESHSQRLLLSAFDRDKMDGYLTFQDQIDAYFASYQSFRVTLRIVQTSEENHRGVILADFQLESEPHYGGPISRRQAQLRFELERTPKGWKIVDFNPRSFFS